MGVDKVVSALRRYNFDLDVVRVHWWVQGNPKNQPISNGSHELIGVLLVPLVDRSWKSGSNDAGHRTRETREEPATCGYLDTEDVEELRNKMRNLQSSTSGSSDVPW